MLRTEFGPLTPRGQGLSKGAALVNRTCGGSLRAACVPIPAEDGSFPPPTRGSSAAVPPILLQGGICVPHGLLAQAGESTLASIPGMSTRVLGLGLTRPIGTARCPTPDTVPRGHPTSILAAAAFDHFTGGPPFQDQADGVSQRPGWHPLRIGTAQVPGGTQRAFQRHDPRARLRAEPNRRHCKAA